MALPSERRLNRTAGGPGEPPDDHDDDEAARAPAAKRMRYLARLAQVEDTLGPAAAWLVDWFGRACLPGFVRVSGRLGRVDVQVGWRRTGHGTGSSGLFLRLALQGERPVSRGEVGLVKSSRSESHQHGRSRPGAVRPYVSVVGVSRHGHRTRAGEQVPERNGGAPPSSPNNVTRDGGRRVPHTTCSTRPPVGRCPAPTVPSLLRPTTQGGLKPAPGGRHVGNGRPLAETDVPQPASRASPGSGEARTALVCCPGAGRSSRRGR